MLITKLKDKETLLSLINGKKVFVLNCHGCKEVSFPLEEVNAFQKELQDAGMLSGIFTTDYICNVENLKARIAYHEAELAAADCVLVFSCGVGVQTAAELFDSKRVYAACDTLHVPGFQGVTPLNVDCGQCGECYLNMTGGICPIAACSKSLVNGPCGGTKQGKCEVDPCMDCGWERIYRKLEKLGKLENLQKEVKLHDFSTYQATKEFKEVHE